MEPFTGVDQFVRLIVYGLPRRPQMSIRRELSRHSRVLAMLVALTSIALITGSVAATTGPSNRQLTVSLGSPTVLPDGHVTFSLSAPQATQVMLNFQLSLIHISEPTRLGMISYAVFCL